VPESSLWFSPPAFAKELGVEPPKVIAWIRSGELVAVNIAQRVGGRPRYRISREAIETFLRRRSTSPAPKVSRRKRESRGDVFGLLG